MFFHLGHHLFNTCGVDTTIAHQLMESQTTSLTTYGIEATDNDSLGGVINNNLNASRCLKRTDVTALTTNDTTLHFIVIDMEYADRVFHCRLSSHTLDSLDDDLLGLSIGIEFGLIHNLIDVTGSSSLGLILHRLHQTVLSLLCTQSRHFLQLLTLLQLHFLQFLGFHTEEFLFVVKTLLLVVEFVLTTTQFLLTLVQRDLTLFQFVLTLLDVLVALLHFLLQLALLVQELLLHLKQFLFFDNLGLFRSRLYHFPIFPFQDITEDKISTDASQSESACGN